MDDILLVEYEEEIFAARLNEKMEIVTNFLRKGFSPEDVAAPAKDRCDWYY